MPQRTSRISLRELPVQMECGIEYLEDSGRQNPATWKVMANRVKPCEYGGRVKFCHPLATRRQPRKNSGHQPETTPGRYVTSLSLLTVVLQSNCKGLIPPGNRGISMNLLQKYLSEYASIGLFCSKRLEYRVMWHATAILVLQINTWNDGPPTGRSGDNGRC